MTITECKVTPELNDYQEVKIGKLYFFKKFVVGEFYEGVHIDFKNFEETTEIIQNYFKGKDFGFVANRTNTYSLNLNDANLFNETFKNLKAYAVVSYSLLGKGIFEVENQFFTFNRRIFNRLEDSIAWVEDVLN